jgi:outer membrane protein
MKLRITPGNRAATALSAFLLDCRIGNPFTPAFVKVVSARFLLCCFLLGGFLPKAGAAIDPATEGALQMSLQDCIDYAMSHADTIKNVRLQILKQHAQNNQIKAGALPQINAGGQFDAYIDPQKALLPANFLDPTNPALQGKFTPVQFTPKYQTNANVTARQTLFDGSLLVALKARKTIMEVVRAAANLTEQGVAYNIQRAYYASVIGEQQFRTIGQSLAVARDLADDMRVMYETGVAEKIDVDRSQVQLNNLRSDSLRSASLLLTSKQVLKYTMGMEIDRPIELTDTAITDNVAAAVDLLTEQLDYSRLTQHILAEKTISLAEYNVKRYQLSGLPTLNAYGTQGTNYGAQRFNEVTRFGNYLGFTVVGLQLNIPIFTGLRRVNQVREAKLDVEMAKNRMHLLEQSINFQTAQAQTALKNALLTAENQKRSLGLSTNVLDLARKKFKAGVGSNLEVNQAQTDLLVTQNSYFNALLDVVNAQSDLQFALGGFSR